MWVLVLVISTTNLAGGSVAMHDFSDQAACAKALELAQHADPSTVRVRGFCTAKAVQPASQ